MKIKFLGTGAADWPKENTENRKDLRRFSSVILDGELLIDPGPRVFDAMAEYNINPHGVKYIINTHKHPDHFSEDTLNRLKSLGASFVEIKAGEEVTLGKYKVYAYAGNHGTYKGTVHFIITDSDKTLFYGLDGAWLLYDEVAAIKTHKPDLAVLDGTVGFIEGDYRIFEHNNLNMVLEMKKSLSSYVKKFCISHMAKTLHTAHEELHTAMEKEGIIVACDGMEIEL